MENDFVKTLFEKILNNIQCIDREVNILMFFEKNAIFEKFFFEF